MSTAEYYRDDQVTLLLGDALDVLPALPDASVDAVVCDPPYGLEFMGREWDGADGFRRSLNPADAGRDNAFGRTSAKAPEYRAGPVFQQWCQAWATECLRVLKPGGHMMAFGAPRTYHRLACAIEDAGFEIRDSLHWIYGSGMPKGQNIGKAIDKAAGAEREVVGYYAPPNGQTWNLAADVSVAGYESRFGKRSGSLAVTAPATDAARQWHGWNTQLRPAHEPIILARRPLDDTTVANVLRHGVGALNVDATRTQAAGRPLRTADFNGYDGDTGGERTGAREDSAHDLGRWPTNVLLTHAPMLDADGQIIGDACAEGCVADCAVAEMDRQSEGKRASKPSKTGRSGPSGGAIYGGGNGLTRGADVISRDDTGGASRFFPVFRYEAKAPASERPRLLDGTAWPTVKPLALMQWLVRLVTPPGGVVLDWCAGTGTTLQAAVAEGMHAIGVEREQDAADLCVIRLARPVELGLFPA